MNELSWLIYAADFAGTLKSVGLFVVVSSVAIAAGGMIFGFAAKSDLDWTYNRDRHPEIRETATRRFNIWKSVVPYLIGGLVVLTVVPSSGTIYAIAASEMGERVIKSETGGKAVEALNAWLDRQIAGNSAE